MCLRYCERKGFQVEVLEESPGEVAGIKGASLKVIGDYAYGHLSTNIVVQCQNDRSQHRNRAEAMAMLKSRLYEEELRKRNAEKQTMEDGKTDIGWGEGHQA